MDQILATWSAFTTAIPSASSARAITTPSTMRQHGAGGKHLLGDFQHDGTQYLLRLEEKGSKSREIPVRHNPEAQIRSYLDSAGMAGENMDRPLFRSTLGKTKRLIRRPLMAK